MIENTDKIHRTFEAAAARKESAGVAWDHIRGGCGGVLDRGAMANLDCHGKGLRNVFFEG